MFRISLCPTLPFYRHLRALGIWLWTFAALNYYRTDVVAGWAALDMPAGATFCSGAVTLLADIEHVLLASSSVAA